VDDSALLKGFGGNEGGGSGDLENAKMSIYPKIVYAIREKKRKAINIEESE
jgi:hypothetical protein